MDSKDRQIEELKALIATGFWKWFVKRNLFSFLLDSIEAKQMHQPAPTLLSASFLYMVQLGAKAFASVDEHTKYQGESVIDQYLDSIGLNTPEAILTRQAYPPAESYVIDKPTYRAAAMQPGGWANANLRTQFLKILRRAGVAPWSRLFHSMRATRQTELERDFPLHVVCSWLGKATGQ